MKLKDFLNQKENSRNKQVSFDLRKRKLKACHMDVDDILNLQIKKSKRKWQI